MDGVGSFLCYFDCTNQLKIKILSAITWTYCLDIRIWVSVCIWVVVCFSIGRLRTIVSTKKRWFCVKCCLWVKQLIAFFNGMFAGWGTNEALIISVLAHRNAAQRKLIREIYNETYGEDLLKALDKELSSDFEVTLCFSKNDSKKSLVVVLQYLSFHSPLTIVPGWLALSRDLYCYGHWLQLSVMLIWQMKQQRDSLQATGFSWKLLVLDLHETYLLRSRPTMLVTRNP